MTDQAMSPLRRRMIEDMTIRKFAPKTQHDYVQRVKNFAAFLGRSPDTASFEDVRRYQLHLATSGAGVPTLNQSVSTLRFFFKITLRRADIVNHTQFVHEPRKLPVVLSPEEVARFIDAAPELKYKSAPMSKTCRCTVGSNADPLAWDKRAGRRSPCESAPPARTNPDAWSARVRSRGPGLTPGRSR